MSESIDHQILVRKMRDWIAAKYFEGDASRIYVDLPELGIDRKPKAVENFIPDLLAHHAAKDIFIIGSLLLAKEEIQTEEVYK